MLLLGTAPVGSPGIWASVAPPGQRFLLANRRCGVWFTALSFTANSTAPWLLLIVSGAAFSWGLAAVWVVAALLIGNLLNWFFVAPRLRAASTAQGTTTILQLLSTETGERLHPGGGSAYYPVLALMLQTGAQLLWTARRSERSHMNSSTACHALRFFARYAMQGVWGACASDALQVGVSWLGLLLPIPALLKQRAGRRSAGSPLGPQSMAGWRARQAWWRSRW